MSNGASAGLVARLARAIRERRIIEFQYRGLPRTVQPLALGLSRGVVEVLGIQVAGATSSGSLPNWRRCRVEEVTGLRLTSESFQFQGPLPHTDFDPLIAIYE